VQIALIRRDAAGKQSDDEISIGLLPFLKSVATAGDIDPGWFRSFRKAIGFLLQYSEHFYYVPHFGFALRHWLGHEDPTELGQFSNKVGKAIADYLARRLSGAIHTHTYEAALTARRLPVVGRRPDLYCDTGHEQFSMEAKGFSAPSVSENAMNNYKAQAQAGPLPVNFAIACVSYNIFGPVGCKYYDPPVGDAPYNNGLNRMLARLKYARLLSLLDELPRTGTSTVANQTVERFRITTDEDIPITFIVDDRIRRFVRRSRVVLRKERIEEKAHFIDNESK
jgi:hypothetical protein